MEFFCTLNIHNYQNVFPISMPGHDNNNNHIYGTFWCLIHTHNIYISVSPFDIPGLNGIAQLYDNGTFQ